MHFVFRFRIAVILTIANIISPYVLAGKVEARNTEKKYDLVIAGSWNSLSNDKLNDNYLKAWGVEDDRINSGYGIAADLRYHISSKISVGGGVIYIYGSSIYDRTVLPSFSSDTIYTEDYVKTRIVAPTVSLRYHMNLYSTDFSLGISESLVFGKASRHHTLGVINGEFYLLEGNYYSNGIGLQFFVGIKSEFNRIASYFMEVGYRQFKTGDLVEKDTEKALRYFDSVYSDPINLDYSGPYISAGLMFRLF